MNASRASKNVIYSKLGKYTEMIQGFVKKMTTPHEMTPEEKLRLMGPSYPQEGMTQKQRDMLAGIAADQDARNRKSKGR